MLKNQSQLQKITSSSNSHKATHNTNLLPANSCRSPKNLTRLENVKVTDPKLGQISGHSVPPSATLSASNFYPSLISQLGHDLKNLAKVDPANPKNMDNNPAGNNGFDFSPPLSDHSQNGLFGQNFLDPYNLPSVAGFLEGGTSNSHFPAKNLDLPSYHQQFNLANLQNFGNPNQIQSSQIPNNPLSESTSSSSIQSSNSTNVSTGSSNIHSVGYESLQDPSIKPPYSYIALITRCIESSAEDELDQMCTLNEIYTWIKTNYPYYQKNEQRWQNSIRHSLSFNDCFERVPKDYSRIKGKGSYWRLVAGARQQFKDGCFLRRQKRYRKEGKF